MNLVPITEEVEVPYDLHHFIFREKCKYLCDLMERYDVNIPIPPQTDQSNVIKITGTPASVESAKAALKEWIEVLEEEIQARILHSFQASFEVDPQHYPKIIGCGGAVVTKIRQDHNVQIHLPDRNSSDQRTITIVGYEQDVEAAKNAILKIVQEQEDTYRDVVRIDPRFHSRIIGTGGRNISKIMNDFHVKIRFPRGTPRDPDLVVIIGAKNDVLDAKDHLLNLEEQYEQLITIECVIPQCHHRTIMGSKRSKVKSLSRQYKVRIKFPEDRFEDSVPDEVTINDDSPINGTDQSASKKCDVILVTGKPKKCEAAKQALMNLVPITEEVKVPYDLHHFIFRQKGKYVHNMLEFYNVKISIPPQTTQPDVIKIAGTRASVESAKAALKERIEQLEAENQDRMLHSFQASFDVDPQCHRKIIGRGKAIISKIGQDHNVQIIFPDRNSSNQSTITVVGYEQDVEAARNAILKIIQEQEDVYREEVRIDRRCHSKIIGNRERNVSKIMRDFHVEISFPRETGGDPDLVVITGAKNDVLDAKDHLLSLEEQYKQLITIECVIPQCHHRTMMGSKRSKVQSLSQQYNVRIKFPEKDRFEDSVPDEVTMDDDCLVDGTDQNAPKKCDIILVTGKPENCEAAVQALMNLVPVTEEVEVPYDLHRFIIGKKGKDVHNMMERYDVNLSIPPQTDQSDVIKITGTPASVESAKSALKERIEQLEAEKQDRILRSFQASFEVDPQYHPKIIGCDRAIIPKIRQDHNVQINFPHRNSMNQSTITVVGYEQDVEAAKNAILKIVQEQILRSFQASFELDPQYYPKLIGHDGAIITKIRQDHNVEINFPDLCSSNQSTITVVGYEQDVEAAKNAILKTLQEQEDMYCEEVRIDPRCHSKIFGTRGWNVSKIMKDFHVEVTFPRETGGDPDLVVIAGAEDDVLDAKDHLLNLEEQCIQDIEEQELLPTYAKPPRRFTYLGNNSAGPKGFVVTGAPWDKKKAATDVADTQKLPSFCAGRQ